jgi:bla regulator protein BlaR1
VAPADDAPSVFTALREQLGLRLEPSRTERDVLVIDRLERPTEN